MKTTTFCLSLALPLAAAFTHAQSAASAPVKPGLWETTITSNMQMQLPPEIQARIAAMTPQQQAMMKANMPGGMGGGTPMNSKTRSCSTGQSVQDLLNQAQQKGSQCKLTNQTQSATGMSFDISCTMQEGTASGHSSFTMADKDHVNGTTHMTANMNESGRPVSMTIDSTLSSKYLGADCGDVKPNSAVGVPK
jgi:uncharacterized protein DUF3617